MDTMRRLFLRSSFPVKIAVRSVAVAIVISLFWTLLYVLFQAGVYIIQNYGDFAAAIYFIVCISILMTLILTLTED